MAILCALSVASEYCLNNVADSHEAMEKSLSSSACSAIRVAVSRWRQ